MSRRVDGSQPPTAVAWMRYGPVVQSGDVMLKGMAAHSNALAPPEHQG